MKSLRGATSEPISSSNTSAAASASSTLIRRSVRWKDPIQRYKGLGEMDANQLAETSMDPRHRTLRRISVDDAEAAAEVFELLMGSDVAPRKDFIVANGGHLSDEDLDF